MTQQQTQVNHSRSFSELIKFNKEKVNSVAKKYGFSFGLDVIYDGDDAVPPLLRVHIGSPQTGMISVNSYVTSFLWRGVLSYLYLCKFLKAHESAVYFSFPTWSPHTACASALLTDNKTKTVSLIILQVDDDDKIKVVCYRDIWHASTNTTIPLVGAFTYNSDDEFDKMNNEIYSFISFQSHPPALWGWIVPPMDAYSVLLSELKDYSQQKDTPLSFKILQLPLVDENFTKSDANLAGLPPSLVCKRLTPLVGWWNGGGWGSASATEYNHSPQVSIVSVFCYNTVIIAEHKDRDGQTLVYPIAAIDLLRGDIETFHYLGSKTRVVPHHRIIKHNMHPVYQLGEARTLYVTAVVGNPKVWDALRSYPQKENEFFYTPYFPQVLSVPTMSLPERGVLLPVGAIEIIIGCRTKLTHCTFVYQNAREILIAAQGQWGYIPFNASASTASNVKFQPAKSSFVFNIEVDEFLHDPQTYLNSIMTFTSTLLTTPL